MTLTALSTAAVACKAARELTDANVTVVLGRRAKKRRKTAEDHPIHVVTAAVLVRVAELCPDLATAVQSGAYRRTDRPLASAEAETRLAQLRSR